MKRLIGLILFFGLAFPDVAIDKTIVGAAKSSYFFPYTSSVFGLMDLSPSVVNTFGSAKDFKVDWVWANNAIPKDISLEADALWMLFFSRVSYQEYQAMPYLVRRLGDVSFSLGENLNGTNGRIGLAVKIPLYRQWTAMEDKALFAKIQEGITKEEQDLFEKIVLAKDPAEAARLTTQLENMEKTKQDRAYRMIQDSMVSNWNAGYVDVGYGEIMKFSMRENDYASFQYVSNVHAAWVNGGFGVGKYFLVSAVARYYWPADGIAALNIRFGRDAGKMGFLEYAIETQGFTNASHWINVGANFDIKSKVFLSLGLKTQWNEKFALQRLQPIVNCSFKL